MNYGKKTTEVQTINSLSKAFQVLTQVRINGQVFRIDFKKKTDGSMRTMVCRCGVHAGIKGTGKRKPMIESGLLSVFEFGTGYRSVPIDNIKTIKQGGVVYKFDLVNFDGIYPHGSLETHIKGRTVPAYTSPMYAE